MRVIIQPDYNELSQWAADYVVHSINRANPTARDPFVLGLPTGSSPLGMYKCLIKHYQEKKVSFRHVITFNMDEYIGLSPEHPQSYHYFMWHNFFDHVDIDPKNVNIMDGNAPDLVEECMRFEEKMEEAGGVDLFIGGIGPDGHIAFNEPGSSLVSRTRIKQLTHDTIVANSRFFENDIRQVPESALTVGVGTILDAKEILILVNGYSKAKALVQAIEGAVSQMWPITALQLHKNSIIVCDEAATLELKVGNYKYFKEIQERVGYQTGR
ncbi:MAG: glucosamine-6-phosphate deaminase [Candidatus Azobacteroides sp.]|nr:glucosamine-6-phosphate deaminase [Candidatus Azobacteroides sp.]